MGRWGDGIYESNSALDYFSTISDRFEREIAYWFSPEHVIPNGYWLDEVFTVIETVVLFEQHDIGSTVYLENPNAVDRWRETFLSVWDGQWTHDDAYGSYEYDWDTPTYRLQHRPGAVALFDHLKGIAQDWEVLDRNDTHTKAAPLHPDYPLPYFSIKLSRFIRKLIETLIQEITYWLAYKDWIYMPDDEIVVAVDVLGFLCDVYHQSPAVTEELVHSWRRYTLDIFSSSYGDRWNESHLLYQNIMKSFDRLEAMAKKYPPRKW